ncbi:MAG: glutathione S-transferase [Venatoribacter sp.]
MIKLHHLEYSRSFRILWALEELGLDYQLINYKRCKDLSAPKELKAIHPLGKAPLLEVDGQVIAESAVILDYLQSHYDQNHRFKPSDSNGQTQYNFWMHFAEGSVMPYLVFTLVMQQLGKKPIPPIIRNLTGAIGMQVFRQFMQPRLTEQVEFIEAHLANNEHFAGDFSFADVQMVFALLGLQEIPNMPAMPNIQRYLTKVLARDAYKKAQAKSPDGGKVTRQ